MSLSDNRKYFDTIDYVIFGASLLLSSLIGIYFAYKSRNETSLEEYLLGSRKIHWFPIFVSMVASFFSAVGVLGIPAQIYTTGVTFSFHFLSFLITCFVAAEVFTPLFRSLQLTSVNEYLEMRYSYSVRILGHILFLVQYLLYLSVALYAPALALQSVSGVPIYITVILTGIVCTFYTSIGGMKAVIWTDVFQSLVMVVGLASIVGIAIKQVGSISQIFKTAKKWGRLDLETSFDPRTYHSFWGVSIGLSFSVINSWTSNQPTMQRIVAARSTKDAKRALYASFVGLCLIFILLTLATLSVFAIYESCDLVKDSKISRYDQILPYFIINELGKIKGIAGLFTAVIFSFALSTLSSGLNAMSALFLEDVLKIWRPAMGQRKQMLITKSIAVLGGMFVTGFAFVIPTFGNYIMVLTIQIFSIAGAPLFTMFLIGYLSKIPNSFGVYCGALCGIGVGLFLSAGQFSYPPDKQLPPISVRACTFYNATNLSDSGTIYYKPPQHSGVIATIVSISYTWHGLIIILTTCLVSLLVSMFTGKNKTIEEKLLCQYTILRKCCPCWFKDKSSEKYKEAEVLENSKSVEVCSTKV